MGHSPPIPAQFDAPIATEVVWWCDMSRSARRDYYTENVAVTPHGPVNLVGLALGNHHDSGETVGGIIYTDSSRSTLIQLSGSGPLVPYWDRVAWEGEVMRSEARLAYRKSRTLFFRDSEFTQIDKLNAAKRLRTRIPELADCGADFTEIANTAGSEVRQDLQIERSIRNINERKRHRSASINIQNNGPQTLSFLEGPAGESGVPAELAARRR